LGSVFDDFQAMLIAKTREGRPIGTLPIEMDRKDCCNWRGLRSVENSSNRGGIEIEGCGVNVGQNGGCPGAEDGTDGGEEAEGGSNDSHAGADSRCGDRQPKRVRA
jgi:hypothetical protein